MPSFELEASIDEVEFVAGENALPGRPLNPPPVLPMIPLSSQDLVTLSNPEPFEPGQVGLDLDTLDEAATRLGNRRWYLFRPKDAPDHYNTTFVLPWPGVCGPAGRMRLQFTGHPDHRYLPSECVYTSAESGILVSTGYGDGGGPTKHALGHALVARGISRIPQPNRIFRHVFKQSNISLLALPWLLTEPLAIVETRAAA